jgi:hypothetical protein
MRKVAILAAMLLTAGCQAIDKSKPPARGAIRISGHPYWTLPNCKRHQPLGKWDNGCDVPYVGLSPGFANSGFDIGGPFVSGSGPIGP